MNAAIDLEPLRARIEDFLPLLVFFVIWWVSSRMAEKKRSSQDGQGQARASKPGPSEAPSSKQAISPLDVLRQMLLGELEMPPPQPQPSGTQLPEDFGDAYREDIEWQAQPPLPSAPAERIAPATFAREEGRQPPVRMVSLPPATKLEPERTALTMARVTRRELQRAVLWSEVLAPPISLRNE